jgi:hypothetical protein
MGYLKNENLNTCVSLLREFIDEAKGGGKKGIAILALNQLQKIAAGTTTESLTCVSRPRADGTS